MYHRKDATSALILTQLYEYQINEMKFERKKKYIKLVEKDDDFLSESECPLN